MSISSDESSNEDEVPTFNRWIDREVFMTRVSQYPKLDFCSYSPPRGPNRYLFCSALAIFANRRKYDFPYEFRCLECTITTKTSTEGKVGRGKMILEAPSIEAYKEEMKLKYHPPARIHPNESMMGKDSDFKQKEESPLKPRYSFDLSDIEVRNTPIPDTSPPPDEVVSVFFVETSSQENVNPA